MVVIVGTLYLNVGFFSVSKGTQGIQSDRTAVKVPLTFSSAVAVFFLKIKGCIVIVLVLTFPVYLFSAVLSSLDTNSAHSHHFKVNKKQSTTIKLCSALLYQFSYVRRSFFRINYFSKSAMTRRELNSLASRGGMCYSKDRQRESQRCGLPSIVYSFTAKSGQPSLLAIVAAISFP